MIVKLSQQASVPRKEQTLRSTMEVSELVTGRSPDGDVQRVDISSVNGFNPLANSTTTLKQYPYLRAPHNDRPTSASQPDEVKIHARVSQAASCAHQMGKIRITNPYITLTIHPENSASSAVRPGDVYRSDPPALNATSWDGEASSAHQPAVKRPNEPRVPLTTNNAQLGEMSLYNSHAPFVEYNAIRTAQPVAVSLREPYKLHAAYAAAWVSSAAQHDDLMYPDLRASRLRLIPRGQAASCILRPDDTNPGMSAPLPSTHHQDPDASVTFRTDVPNADPRGQVNTRDAYTANGASNAQRPSEYPLYTNLSAPRAHELRLFLDRCEVPLGILQNAVRRIDERCKQFRTKQRLHWRSDAMQAGRKGTFSSSSSTMRPVSC